MDKTVKDSKEFRTCGECEHGSTKLQCKGTALCLMDKIKYPVTFGCRPADAEELLAYARGYGASRKQSEQTLHNVRTIDEGSRR